MRPLELLSFALAAAALLAWLVPPTRRPAWARALPLVAGAALLLQAGVEGRRSQLDPLYLAGAAMALAALIGTRVRWHHAITVLLVGVVGLAWVLGLALATGSPMFELPKPSGPYAIGTTRLQVEDTTRQEIFTADPDDHRILVVRFWYPAEPMADGEPVPYWDDVERVGPLMAQMSREVLGLSVPDGFVDHYADIATHAVRDAPPRADAAPMPVLVYSHGYGLARPTSNTALMEELASRGYFVASIAHTYETPGVVLDDGRVLAWDEEAVSGLLDDEGNSFFESYAATPDPAARDALARAYIADETESIRSMKVWAADTRTVVDEIERIASGSRPTPFAGKLDLERLGVLGMSFGGATAGVFCVEDPRCKAGVNLDGFHYGEGMADAVVRVPFMIIEADRGEIPMNDFFLRHAEGPIHHVAIEGATHMNFTDTSISSPSLRWLGALGPIDGQRMLAILNDFVPAFFDRVLRGEGSGFPTAPASYPEVEVTSRN